MGQNPQERVLGYIRCSTLTQVKEGETLERQEEQIRAYCSRKGLTGLEIIRDEGISGYSDNRPGFKRLMQLCQSRKVGTVVIYDLSRLSRSVRSTLAFVEDIVQQHGIDFVCLKGDIDTTNAMGKTFLAILAVLNEHFRNEIQFRTLSALEHKRSKGEKLGGHTPYGYDVLDGGRLALNGGETAALNLIRSLRSSGLSLRKIASELQARGIRTKLGNANWSPQTIRTLLRRMPTQGPVTDATDGDNTERSFSDTDFDPRSPANAVNPSRKGGRRDQ